MTGNHYNQESASNQTGRIYDFLAYLYLATIIIAIAFFNASPLAYLALVFFGAIFILPRPDIGLNSIILLTMTLERFFTLQSLSIGRDSYKLYPLDIVIGLTALGLLLQIIRRKSSAKLTWQAPEKLLFVFMLMMAAYLAASYFNINSSLEVAFSTFKNYAFYPLLYFLAIWSVKTPERLKSLGKIFILGGVLIVFFIIFGLINGQGLWTEFTPLSTAGTRFLAGTHAFYLIASLFLVINLLIFKQLKQPWLFSALIWLWALGIAGSLMRHLWLALSLAGLTLFWLWPARNKKIAVQLAVKNLAAAVAVIALIFLIGQLAGEQKWSQDLTNNINNFSQRLTSMVSGLEQDSSINWRFEFWSSAKEIWLEHPWLGVGLGRKMSLELSGWKTFEEIRSIHNSPLGITIQMGLVGLGLFLAFVISVIVASWKKLSASVELTPYYLAFFCFFAALSVASFFQPYLETNLTGIFFWLTLGLIRTAGLINQKYENTASQ